MSTIRIFLWVQQGVAYIFDPAHRIITIGIALFIILMLRRIIVRGIKLILLIGIIFALFYFGLKYLTVPIN